MVEYINGKRVIEGYTEGARVYNDANISISNTTLTALTFNSERWDTDSIHSTVSNTGRLTATTAGTYLISVSLTFALNATGYREVALKVDGTTFISNYQRINASASVTTDITTSTIWKFAAGSYVECIIFQNSGGALDVKSAASYTPEFMMQRIG